MQISRTWLATILVAAFGAHVVAFLGYAPGDVYGFVRPWFRELMAHGFLHPVGNYAPPYLYLLWAMTLFNGLLWQVVLIKLLAVFGALWMAFAASRVIDALGGRKDLAVLTLALPSIILDVSLLGQADTFWIAPCLLATAAGIKGDNVRVAAWAGLAFAVKAQAAFFAPFVLYLFAHRDVPLRTWLVAPVVLVAAWFPAWAMGWPFEYLATLYFGQFDWVNNAGDYFVGSGANPWVPMSYLWPEATFNARWIGMPLVALTLAAYWRLMPRPTAENLLPAAAISAAIVPFVLPLMLDRFFLLADLLCVCYAIARPSGRTIAIAVLMQAASALPMLAWAFRLQPLEAFTAPLSGLALFLLCSRVYVARARGGAFEPSPA